MVAISTFCVNEHSAWTCLFYIQDTVNFLTRWAIPLQAYDFGVEQLPRKWDIMPNTLLPRRFGKNIRTAIARALVERVVSVFGLIPDSVHFNVGPEFENKVIEELQSVFGYKKTRTTPYRPQGNSVFERVHSTLCDMLSAMYR